MFKIASWTSMVTGMKIVVALSLSAVSLSAHAAPVCKNIFAKEMSMEQVDVNLKELTQLRLHLDDSVANGLSSVALSAMKADYQKKEMALVSYVLGHGLLTRAEIIEKMKAFSVALQKNAEQGPREKKSQKESQKRAIVEGLIDGRTAVFHQLEAGSFKMGKKAVDVTLTKPFQISATPTTQIVWRRIAELANGLNYNLPVDPSNYKGETFPVESVSYMEVKQWLKALNEMSLNGEPSLKDIIRDHRDGDQYRLPTEAEWEYMARGAGKFNSISDLTNGGRELSDYGFFPDLTKKEFNKLGPVATKLPIQIGEQDFFDVFGNVFELVSDGMTSHPPGGVDPHVISADGPWVARGLSLLPDMAAKLGMSLDEDSPFTTRFTDSGSRDAVGFRLVREVK